jgi:hypothetical protein
MDESDEEEEEEEQPADDFKYPSIGPTPVVADPEPPEETKAAAPVESVSSSVSASASASKYVDEGSSDEDVDQAEEPEEIYDRISRQIDQSALDVSLTSAAAGASSTIPAVQAPSTLLSEQGSLACRLINQEVVSGGIFSSSFVMFTIKTVPLDWEVRRRYSDFKWLRDRLVISFPGRYVPPVPKKKSRGRMEENFVLRRKYSLERLLNAVVRNPLFARCIPVEMFLKEQDPKTWSAYKKEKLRGPDRVEQFVTLDGSVQLNLRDEHNERYTNLDTFIPVVEKLSKRMKAQSKQLIEDLKSLSGTLAGMS